MSGNPNSPAESLKKLISERTVLSGIFLMCVTYGMYPTSPLFDHAYLIIIIHSIRRTPNALSRNSPPPLQIPQTPSSHTKQNKNNHLTPHRTINDRNRLRDTKHNLGLGR